MDYKVGVRANGWHSTGDAEFKSTTVFIKNFLINVMSVSAVKKEIHAVNSYFFI